MVEQNSPLSISIIKQAADAGDVEVLEALAETGNAMGIGFASLINMLNPEKIILGGPLSIFGEYLLPSIKDVATKNALPEMRPTVEILQSSFDTDASLIGAVSIVVDDILSNPTHIERR
jgi:predicted NBD/HSP70 family sugar kinase